MLDVAAALKGIEFLDKLRDKDRAALLSRIKSANESAQASHHINVVSWSQQVHELGHVSRVNGPIPLSFGTIPRRLGIGAGESLDEDDLLLRDSHIAVLGDAGAGKTTTLRRIAGMIATTPSFSDLFDRVVLV